MSALTKPSQPTAEMATLPPSRPVNRLLSSGDCEESTVASVVRILICASVGPGVEPTALAVKLVFRLNPFLENILHKPPATLVGTVVVAITRMASDLVASAVNTRNWLLLVLRVPQVVLTFCTLPGVKLLRVALWLAKPAAVLAPAQLPPRLTASSTAISATRCNLRCSRYRRPLSTTSSINSSTMPSVTAAIRPIAPCCCRGP